MAAASAVFKTVVFCSSVFAAGSQLGLMGPTLPEVLCLFDVDSTQTTYILLFLGLGSMLGMIVTPFMLKRLVSYRYCACLTALMCIYFCCFTVSGIYAAYVIVFVGASAGASIVNAALIEVSKLWPSEVRMVYIIFASIASGSVLGPLVLLPFLSDGVIVQTYKSREMSPRRDINLSIATNVTNILSHSNTTIDSKCDQFITFIELPYLMFGTLALVFTLLYIYLSVKDYQNKSDVYTSIEEETQTKYGQRHYVFVTFMVFLCTQGQGLPTGYSSLLATYGVQGDLHLSLSTMTSMTCLFWFCFLFGRASLGVIPSRTPQIAILTTCLCGSVVGLVFLCFASKSEIPLWIASGIIGLSSSGLSPSTIAWMRGRIPMTPVLTTVCLTGIAVGFVFPFIGGKLMNQLGVQAFPYFLLVANLISVVAFIIAYIISKYL